MVATNKEFFGFNPFVGVEISSIQRCNLDILNFDDPVCEAYFLSTDNKYGAWLMDEGQKLKKGQLLQLRKSVIRPQRENECPTLTANMGLGGHNVPFLIHGGRLRKMTERECLRMQGFPESFDFPNLPMNAKYRMIGNAVSPLVALPLAKQIKEEICNQQKFMRKAS
jgi:DNA (cytosine-5)-methyltransferase 1